MDASSQRAPSIAMTRIGTRSRTLEKGSGSFRARATGKPGFGKVAHNAQGTGCTSPIGPHAIASAQAVKIDG